MWMYRGICAALMVIVIVLAARTWRHWQIGQVDPVSACIALAGLALAVWAGRQAMLAQRAAEADAGLSLSRLADAVLAAESVERTQLLAGQRRTIDVDFVLRPAPGHNATGAAAEGRLEEVLAYYQRLNPRRLVITGVAGAGKTVLAIELILGLLAVREADDPVPVRVSAAAWDTSVPLRAWLAEHLVQTFRFTPTAASALVDAGKVLPVMDGLDEMDADESPGYGSQAAKALRSLNTYQRGQRAAQLILTCRTGQYDALTAAEIWAEDAARIDLVPVTPGKAWAFIEAYVGEHNLRRWRPVLDALTDPAHVLAAALATPWRLTLAVTVYQERAPETGRYLREPAALTEFTSEERIRDHLLGGYIPAATAAAEAATGEAPYPPAEAHAWLGVLAGYLNANATRPPFGGRSLSSTDLVLHELWPLAGRRVRHVTALLALSVALVFSDLLLLQASVTLTWEHIRFAGIMLIPSVMALVLLWRTYWPTPSHIDFAALRSSAGRRRMALGVTFGIAVAIAIGSQVGLGTGLAAGLALAMWTGLGASNISPGMTPRDVVRADFASWLTFAITFGLAFGLAAWRNNQITFALPAGLAIGLAAGLATGLLTGEPGGAVTFRYVAFIFCVHPVLPLRLGAFLDWSYHAGLLRVAGIAYQFRHRELQDYLVANPRSYDSGMADERPEDTEPTPLGHAQTGLRGRLARVLVEEPTNEIDWPADLPAGIRTVVILDDTPNPHHTLRVHPPDDPTRVALVVYDQLALCDDAPEA